MTDNLYDRFVWSAPGSGALVFELVGPPIPVKPSDGADSLLIGVRVTVVGEKRKACICSRIDSH